MKSQYLSEISVVLISANIWTSYLRHLILKYKSFFHTGLSKVVHYSIWTGDPIVTCF